MGSIDALSASYSQQQENTIRVYKHRAHYDYQTVHAILAATLYSTVSFVIYDQDGDPAPFSLPMTAVSGQYNSERPLRADDGPEEEYIDRHEACHGEPYDLYLHGNSAMLLSKMSKKGSLKIVVSSTKVDGVVLHFAPNGHSLNYRSCVIHGDAVPVTDPAEKLYAMHRLTNHLSRRRWSAVNEVAPEAMRSVQVVKVVVRSASAKIRATNINGLEKAGLGARDDVWTGVVPVYETLGEAVESGVVKRPMQKQIVQWVARRNEEEKAYATEAAQVPPESDTRPK